RSWGIDRSARMSLLPLTFQLPFVDASHLVNGGDLLHGLVVPDSSDTRKSKRISRLVPPRFLNAVEGDLQHNLRSHHVDRAVTRCRRLLEVPRQLIDLHIGQPRVR